MHRNIYKLNYSREYINELHDNCLCKIKAYGKRDFVIMFSSTSKTDISTGKIQNSQLRMNGASTPPPGLQFTSTDYTTNGLASLHGINRIGATSAPPPPGFSTAPDQRNSRLRGGEGQQGYLLNPADLTTNRDNSDRTRSKSFVNLAATLGNGLIESMNDSFSDQQQINDIIR